MSKEKTPKPTSDSEVGVEKLVINFLAEVNKEFNKCGFEIEIEPKIGTPICRNNK